MQQDQKKNKKNIKSRSCCYSVTVSQLWQNGLFVYDNISLEHPTPNGCFILNNASRSLGVLLSASGVFKGNARRDGAWEANSSSTHLSPHKGFHGNQRAHSKVMRQPIIVHRDLADPIKVVSLASVLRVCANVNAKPSEMDKMQPHV